VQRTRHLLEFPILPVRGKIIDFIGHQLKANAIKIADLWEEKGI